MIGNYLSLDRKNDYLLYMEKKRKIITPHKIGKVADQHIKEKVCLPQESKNSCPT
jgi:hypothetical protein